MRQVRVVPAAEPSYLTIHHRHQNNAAKDKVRPLLHPTVHDSKTNIEDLPNRRPHFKV